MKRTHPIRTIITDLFYVDPTVYSGPECNQLHFEALRSDWGAAVFSAEGPRAAEWGRAPHYPRWGPDRAQAKWRLHSSSEVSWLWTFPGSLFLPKTWSSSCSFSQRSFTYTLIYTRTGARGTNLSSDSYKHLMNEAVAAATTPTTFSIRICCDATLRRCSQ